MSPMGPNHERLLRFLDGRVTPEERRSVADLLRSDPEARRFLRDVAEHAVVVADLERVAAARDGMQRPGERLPADDQDSEWRSAWRFRKRILAAAAAVAAVAVMAMLMIPAARRGAVQVSKVTGSSRCFAANGKLENKPGVGAWLGAGDTLETRSCDAWVELKRPDGSTITISGHSTLRILNDDAGGTRFKLQDGSLWVKPMPGAAVPTIRIQTPTLELETRGAQFDIQTSATESMLRVNEGSVRVRQDLDGSEASVSRGEQLSSSLNRRVPLSASAQPRPVDSWACNLGRVPEVLLGRWLPPTDAERARLGAEPLLWPIPDQPPLLLHAVALAAWKSTEHPVTLHSDSRLVFRGRTERAHTVRFGFSAQKMRGVFAGKFEVDVPPAALGPVGETWEVELPLRDFQPLHPQLVSSPDGLELTDVYALTVNQDAGLEINHIELIPQTGAQRGIP